jgi:hypothetical protein
VPPMPGMAPGPSVPASAHALFYRLLLVGGLFVLLVVVELAVAAPAPKTSGADASADAPARRARDRLARALGVLWLVDAALQAQPTMIMHFVGGVLAPLVAGQPAPVASVVRLGAAVWRTNPAGFDALSTLVQAFIGICLLAGADGSRLRRLGAGVGVAWAVVVWSAGEAFGGLFAEGGVLQGSPGAALFYALGAVLILATRDIWGDGRVWRWQAKGWAGLFALWAVLQAWPPSGLWHGAALATYVRSMAAMPQPAANAAVLSGFAALLSRAPAAASAAIVACCLALAAAWLWRPTRWATVVATALWLTAVWWLGEDFGVLGGMGTDPNTGGVLLVYAGLWAAHLADDRGGRSKVPVVVGAFGRTGAEGMESEGTNS